MNLIFRVLFVLNVLLFVTAESDYVLKQEKYAPRITRANNKNTNIDEMGKFFMKASKSVPRIGRRNKFISSDGPDNGQETEYAYLQNRDKNSFWNDIANKFEYEPELFTDPEFIRRLEQEINDDNNIASEGEWNKIRVRRNDRKPMK